MTIKKLSKKKAPGMEKIPNLAFRPTSKRTILHITKIYNSYLHREHFPSPWKLATVVIIPKSGKNKKELSNHRPISLLNFMAKLLKSLILLRLKKTTAKFIRHKQFAFRAGHLSTNQLTKLIDNLVTCFTRQ